MNTDYVYVVLTQASPDDYVEDVLDKPPHHLSVHATYEAALAVAVGVATAWKLADTTRCLRQVLRECEQELATAKRPEHLRPRGWKPSAVARLTENQVRYLRFVDLIPPVHTPAEVAVWLQQPETAVRTLESVTRRTATAAATMTAERWATEGLNDVFVLQRQVQRADPA